MADDDDDDDPVEAFELLKGNEDVVRVLLFVTVVMAMELEEVDSVETLEHPRLDETVTIPLIDDELVRRPVIEIEDDEFVSPIAPLDVVPVPPLDEDVAPDALDEPVPPELVVFVPVLEVPTPLLLEVPPIPLLEPVELPLDEVPDPEGEDDVPVPLLVVVFKPAELVPSEEVVDDELVHDDVPTVVIVELLDVTKPVLSEDDEVDAACEDNDVAA